MFSANQASNPFGADPKAVFEFWASFSPAAPYFGVEWRFAPLFPGVEQAMQSFWPTPAAATPDTPAAAVEATPEAAAPKLYDAPPAKADDLTKIRGVGPGLAQQMNALGVYTFAQLAGFDDKDLAWLDENLNGLKGACFRGDWAGQAKALAG